MAKPKKEKKVENEAYVGQREYDEAYQNGYDKGYEDALEEIADYIEYTREGK